MSKRKKNGAETEKYSVTMNMIIAFFSSSSTNPNIGSKVSRPPALLCFAKSNFKRDGEGGGRGSANREYTTFYYRDHTLTRPSPPHFQDNATLRLTTGNSLGLPKETGDTQGNPRCVNKGQKLLTDRCKVYSVSKEVNGRTCSP